MFARVHSVRDHLEAFEDRWGVKSTAHHANWRLGLLYKT